MATRYVWNSSAQDDSDSTWNSSTLAFLTVKGAVDASSAGDDIYVHTGATSTHTETISAADENWDGPTQGAAGPITIIGVDKSDDSYNIASTTIITMSSTYDLNIDGCFRIYGLKFALTGTTGYISCQNDYDEGQYFQDCTFDGSSATPLHLLDTATVSVMRFKDCTFAVGSDDQDIYLNSATGEFYGCTFTGTHATADLLTGASNYRHIHHGSDFSGLSTSTLINIFGGNYEFYGCRFQSGLSIGPGGVYSSEILIHESDTDSGNDQYRTEYTSWSGVTSNVDTGVYRTGGATYDGTNGYSYVISLYDADAIHAPAYTQWCTGFLSNTGSKTFTVYIANATADYKDTEVWLEVEYFGSASNTLKTIGTDQDTDPTSAGTFQTDDTASVWSPTKAYMQELSVTATVNRAGSFRWRVGSRVATDIYVDPFVEVT